MSTEIRLAEPDEAGWWCRNIASIHEFIFSEGPASLRRTGRPNADQPGDIVRACLRERLIVDTFGKLEFLEYLNTEGAKPLVLFDFGKTQDEFDSPL